MRRLQLHRDDHGRVRGESKGREVLAVEVKATASCRLRVTSSSVRPWVTTGTSRHSAT